MAQFEFADATSAGRSNVITLSNLGPRGGSTERTVYIRGITTGTVQVQLSPIGQNDWVTPTDGEFTADGQIAVVGGGDISINIDTATDVDVSAWIE
jgi:hypothetical protein